jgi:hypothetical protein
METQMGALLTDRSVAEFREWLKTMPRGVFERRVTGACDASMPEPQPTLPYYNRAAARRLLQFLARKLKPDDLATVWKMIEARLDPNEAPRRRNGHAA